MSCFIRTEMTSDLDRDTTEALNANATLMAPFTPTWNRTPAGTAALEVPCDACESLWAELEEAHRRAFG